MNFHTLTTEQIRSMTHIRDGEIKMGEKILCSDQLNMAHPFSSDSFDYVIIGIQEDIGVRANMGRSGTFEAFQAFLSYFANMQYNRFTKVFDRTLLYGYFNFEEEGNIHKLRTSVEEIDRQLNVLISQIYQSGKIPILIGGGHNNAYPLLKSYHDIHHQSIACINIDAHTDMRAMEGRHSGNGFRYAYEKKILNNYLVIGLQEAYTSESILEVFEESEALNFISWEKMILEGSSPDEYLHRFFGPSQKNISAFGLELDTDVIALFPSSAMSPLGLSTSEVFNLIKSIAQRDHCQYFHICEGAPSLSENGAVIVGKFLCSAIKTFLQYNSR